MPQPPALTPTAFTEAQALRMGLLALLLCTAFHAQADWRILTVNRDKTVNIWIESASMQRRDDYVFAWVIYDRADPAEDGAMSSKVLNQYDCAGWQARTWRQSYYLKSMAGGDKIPGKTKAACEVGDALDMTLDEECTQSWKPVFDRTTGADILKALCVGQAASGAQQGPLGLDGGSIRRAATRHPPTQGTTSAMPWDHGRPGA